MSSKRSIILATTLSSLSALPSLSLAEPPTNEQLQNLYIPVRTAIEKGGNYAGAGAVYWHKTYRCSGCHVQTQGLMGLASSMDKATINRTNAKFLYNTIAGSQQADGSLRISHAQFPRTQTSLGLWALSSWPDKTASFRTMYKAAEYFHNQRIAEEDALTWYPDYPSGWWNTVDAQIALGGLGLAQVVKNADEIDVRQIKDYTLVEVMDFAAGNIVDVEAGPAGTLYVLRNTGSIEQVNLKTKKTTLVANVANPTGLAVATDGTLYVSSANKILRIQPDGKQAILWSGSSTHVVDIELGADNRLYLANWAGHSILRLDLTTQKVETLATGLYYPAGLTFDNAGNLYVANYGGYNISKITPDGKQSIFADGLPFPPLRLDTDSQGNLFVSALDYYNEGYTPFGLYRINADGLAERFPVPTGMQIYSIAQAGGKLYATGLNTQQLFEIKPSTLNKSLLGEFRRDLDLVVDHFLETYQDNTYNQEVHALRLIGLAEALSAGAHRKAEVRTALEYEETWLREHQNKDGGWGSHVGYSSDPLVTSLVGLALVYTDPFYKDPAVYNTVSYLLKTQYTDGSWPNLYNGFTTRLSGTSFVMAYLPEAYEILVNKKPLTYEFTEFSSDKISMEVAGKADLRRYLNGATGVELGETTQFGELVLQADGSFSYLPDKLHCTDSFTYRNQFSDGSYSDYETVNILLKEAPDLVLSQLRYQNDALYVTLSNEGTQPAVDAQVTFYRFDAEQGGMTLGTVPVGLLEPGQRQEVILNNIVGLQEPLNIYAIASADDQLGECNQINNTLILFANGLEGVTPADCQIYGINDEGGNNSQLLSLQVSANMREFTQEELATCDGCDLEGMDSHPQTQVLYAVSGDNTDIGQPKGFLYRIDPKVKTFLPVGSTGFEEVEGLAFDTDGTLYGYVKGEGIIQIDTQTGAGTPVVTSDALVEGFSLDKENAGVFYGVANNVLWQFDSAVDNSLEMRCSNLPNDVESIRIFSENSLLLSSHGQEGLKSFNFQTCEWAETDTTIATPGYGDIESHALVGDGCGTLARLTSLINGLGNHFLHPLIEGLAQRGFLTEDGEELPLAIAENEKITVLPFKKQQFLYTQPGDIPVPSDQPVGVYEETAEDGKLTWTWVFADEQGQTVAQPLYYLQMPNDDGLLECFFRAVPNFKLLEIHGNGEAFYTIGSSLYKSALDREGGIKKPLADDIFSGKATLDWYEDESGNHDANGDGIEDVLITYKDGSRQILFMFGKQEGR